MTPENTAEQPAAPVQEVSLLDRAVIETRAIASFALEGATTAILRAASFTEGKAIALIRSHDVMAGGGDAAPARVGGTLVLSVFTGPDDIDKLREVLTGLGYNITSSPLFVQGAPTLPKEAEESPSVIIPG